MDRAPLFFMYRIDLPDGDGFLLPTSPDCAPSRDDDGSARENHVRCVTDVADATCEIRSRSDAR
jgi:hypothetical protein